MITSISLENWRSHEATSLTFRKGTNLLVGIMGSGKSSVLDAMSFALFGNFPALEHKKLSLGDLIAHGKGRAKVSLGFEWKGEKYEVIRTLLDSKKGATSDAELRKSGKLAEKGQKPVTKCIEQLLQADYDLFSRAIYSEQNGIDRFLTLAPGARKDEMDTLLGLDKFEKARVNVVKVANLKKELLKTLSGKFSKSRLEEMRAKEQDAKSKLSDLENSRKAVQESMQKAKLALESANSHFTSLKSKREKHESLRESISNSNGAISQLSQELAEKNPDESSLEKFKEAKAKAEKSLEDAKKCVSSIQARQVSLSKELGTIQEKLASAKSARAEGAKTLEEITNLLGGKKLPALEKEIDDLNTQCSEFAAKSQAALSEISKLELSMGRLAHEHDHSKCPLCRKPLTKEGAEHVLLEYREEISAKKGEAEKFSSLNSEKSAELKKAREALRKAQALEERQRLLEKTAAQLDSLSEKLLTLEADGKASSTLAGEKTKEMENAQRSFHESSEQYRIMLDLCSKKKKLVELESRVKSSENQLTELKFSEPEYENSRKALEEIKIQAQKFSGELSSIELQFKGLADYILLASQERGQLEAMEKQIAGLESLVEELSIYKNALLETQALLRAEVVDAINTAMNEIWGMVYPYGDYKGVRLVAQEDGYEFEIYGGAWLPAGLVSGGERASIALALRIALAAVLTPNMSLLILDEPTHNLDKEAVGFLAHALQFNLPELVEQSFVITHDEGLMGSEFASTYRMIRDKGERGPTRAELV